MKFFSLSLPTMGQIYESKIYKLFGSSAQATDTAKILGVGTLDNNNDKGCVYRTGSISYKSQSSTVCIGNNGEACYFSIKSRVPGIRPVIKFKSLDYLPNPAPIKNGVYTFTLGNFITNLAEPEIAKELSERENDLEIVDGAYEFDSVDVQNRETFQFYDPRFFVHFSYKGNTYVNIECLSNHNAVLSNGEQTEYGKSYWVKEEPVVWLADSKLNFAITRDIILGGLYLDSKKYTGNLSVTELGHYLTNQFESNLLYNCDEISFKNPGQFIKTEREAFSNEIEPKIGRAHV